MNNILIIGKSVAAEALARKLHNADGVCKVFIAPGGNVKSDLFEYVDLREDDLTGLLKFALENDVSLTIPVSEKALKSDIVSFFQDNGQDIFGPTKESCNIALNNAAGKKFLYKIHAQTAKFGIFDKLQMAEDWLKNANFPVTIKCCEYTNLDDRLVCPTVSLAREFLDSLFSKGETNVLIEEYTYGHNFTVYYITDGYSAVSIMPVGKYKFTHDGDGGILTNGMGAYAPDYKISEVALSRLDNVVRNTLISLEKKGKPYMGILGVECVMTGEDKFYVNEFKPFLQDYDACSVLNLVDDDLIKIFKACIDGLFADEYEEIKLNNLSSVAAVVLSRQFNKRIAGIDKVDDIDNILFCNTKRTENGDYLTGKGEEFVLTRTASTLTRAKTYLYEDLSQMKFDGMRYRKDILI